MKNLKWLVLIIMLIMVFLGSCDMTITENIWDFNCPKINLSSCKTDDEKINEITNWVITNIAYTHDVIDRWQTPQETLNIEKGDCDDMAILIIGIGNHYGIKTDMAVVSQNEYGTLDHYCVHYNGNYYSKTGSNYFAVIDIINFNEIPDYLQWHRGL
jgi:transglutaminase-like putative cysteine protease